MIVLESVQDMLLKLALQMARDDYDDRREHQRHGVELAKGAGKYRGTPYRCEAPRPSDRVAPLRPQYQQDGRACLLQFGASETDMG
ncbi:hypothetical protein [Xanthomonas hortorum]|jgi:DNA invertase Pin-like site-specific DNA recombinase|uniref:hypothetical protein n=1 Tax=Xanthomonas hortorum TaxID=56454 RepID=UPI003CCF6302